MTTQQRFEAAVKVIRNLPKNGSYQPSNSLMLDFYAYYKQATEGTERGSRPSFWDVINRAKWDAWNRLGDMPKEEAMQRYVDGLNKIIETMSLTDNVADFLNSMKTYPGDPEDIELSIGPLLEKVRSRTNSPNGSLDSSPSRNGEVLSSSPVSDLDEEDDEFEDTLPETYPREDIEEHAPVKRKDTPMVMPMSNQRPLSRAVSLDTRSHNGHIPSKSRSTTGSDHVNEALQKAVENLRRDLNLANEKVKLLEERQNKAIKTRGVKLNQMAPGTLAFIIAWPIFVHYFLLWLRRKK
ncbi:Acyl CoA Hypothetical protein protein [Nesidiocoris tenuis]|uniref:ACB domain-containing protein n=1 Tax=Nesidiocoris tenuis TaxID=355587 RepID=A0ABN7ATH3_9HEMI|nr:Acyl CoA Hypothetical protein protein [Nesidiocoris tenuis]